MHAHALRRKYKGGAMTPHELLDKYAPPHDIGIPIRDARGVRKITQADLAGALRLSRGGPHKVELVAAHRYYDGATGGEPGYYANIFVAWRAGSQTWRSGGVRILQFEAERIARALSRGTGTKPGEEEDARIGGTGAVTQLRAKALDNGSVLLFVRFGGQGGRFYRSRGAEIHDDERGVIANGLREFAKLRGRAK